MSPLSRPRKMLDRIQSARRLNSLGQGSGSVSLNLGERPCGSDEMSELDTAAPVSTDRIVSLKVYTCYP